MKIRTLNELADLPKPFRIVHAHGCFDLLHLGHIKYLEAAKKLGEMLIVTVTADKHVNKGPARPIFSAAQRAEMLAALSIVDYVSINDAPSAVPAILAIKPSVYVKGKDYVNSPDDIALAAEREAVESHGGIIAFTDEITFSSTELINKNLDAYKPPLRLNFSGKRILLIGDVMLDHYVYGNVNRLSPEAPVPVLNVEREEFRLGGAGTVLRNLESLGAQTTFVSVIGNDIAGNKVTRLVADIKNCIPYLIQERDRVTTTKTRHIAGHHQITRIDNETITPIDDRSVMHILSHISNDYDAIIISDYGKGIVAPSCQKIISAAQDIPVVIDPKSEWFGLYSGAFIITPNLSEINKATDFPIATEENIKDRCREFMADFNIKNILVTRGSDGMMLQTSDEKTFSIPATAKEIYDVTGAGDTVVAVLSLGIASGMSLQDATVLANKAAGIVVGKTGSAAITLGELCG